MSERDGGSEGSGKWLRGELSAGWRKDLWVVVKNAKGDVIGKGNVRNRSWIVGDKKQTAL